MLKRAVIGLGLLAVVAWLAASVFVREYEPTQRAPTEMRLESRAGGRLRWDLVSTVSADLSDGSAGSSYGSGWNLRRGGATFSPGEPDECEYDYLVVRGNSGPGHGHLVVRAGCAYRAWTPITGVRLEVTSDPDWIRSEADWTEAATGHVDVSGHWQTVALEAKVPLGTVAVRLVSDESDGESWSFGCSLPAPDDWHDRLFETLVGMPFLRWLVSDS